MAPLTQYSAWTKQHLVATRIRAEIRRCSIKAKKPFALDEANWEFSTLSRFPTLPILKVSTAVSTPKNKHYKINKNQ